MDTASQVFETPITKPFLENILKKKIVSFKASSGSKPGDNFTSNLISLEINLEDDPKPKNLLYKTFPQHPARQKMLETTNIFLKEYQVYTLWLPELTNLQKTLIKNDNLLIPAFPKLVGGAAVDYAETPKDQSEVDPILSNFLLMDDVRTSGFQMADKLKSLDAQYVKVVMEEIAKYHALGYAYKTYHKLTNISENFPCFKDPYFTNPKQRPMVVAVMKANLQTILNECKDWLESRPAIAKSMKKIGDPELIADYLNIFLSPDGVDEEKVEGFMRTKPEEYTEAPLKDQWIVVGHGDCWINNLLFKDKETGNEKDVILVDLQIARESCMMADLVYFLYSSTDTAFRKEYLEEMLFVYYEKILEFCEVLKVDPFPGFSPDNFRRKFHRSKLLGFLFAAMVLPIFLNKPQTAVNLDKVKEKKKDADFIDLYSKKERNEDDNKLLRNRFTELLLEMYEDGIL